MMKKNLLFLAILSCISMSAWADTIDSVTERCSDLKKLNFENAKVINSEVIVGDFTPPTKLADTLRGAKSQLITNLPQICRVELAIEPKINVEIWLPTDWNQRLQAIGGGGFAGFIPFDKLAVAAKNGYVSVTTDTGHQGSLFKGDFAFKDNELQTDLITDFAYRSVHEMTVKTKQIIQSYYGEAAKYSYWNGCSTGGRQGLMEVQRFPADYDGVYIIAPAIQWDKFVTSSLWPQIVMQEELGKPIDTAKLNQVREAIIKYADKQDGIIDGVVNDPTTLNISDSFLQQLGLNDAEIISLKKIWQGPTSQSGQFLWYSLEPSADLTPIAGKVPFTVPEDYLRYWIYQKPDMDWKQLGYKGFDDFYNESVELYRPIMGTDNADLSQFKKLGGKMIIWHGWDDQLIPPKGTIHYYNNVQKIMGGKSHTDEFMKLYMAPGVGHCNGGDGADTINGFESLVNWVEKQQSPTTLTAQKIQNGKVTMKRPLCQYPLKAVYKGEVDVNNLANFECK